MVPLRSQCCTGLSPVPFISPCSHIYQQQQWRQKGNNRFVMKMRSKNWVSDSSAIQFFQKSEEGLRHNGWAWLASIDPTHLLAGSNASPPPRSSSRTMIHMPAPPVCPHLVRTCQLMTYFCLMDESRQSRVVVEDVLTAFIQLKETIPH